MNTNQFSRERITLLVVNSALEVVQVENPDATLLFGQFPSVGASLVEEIGEECHDQAQLLVEGVRRAFEQRRNTCLEYRSTTPEGARYVGVVVVYDGDERATIQLRPLDVKLHGRWGFDSVRLLNALPVGVMLYDAGGDLLDINDEGLLVVGADSKSALLGMNLFENPDVPLFANEALRQGKDVRFLMELDFSKHPDYYRTRNTALGYFEFFVSVLRSEAGEIDKYVAVGIDVTLQQTQQRMAQRKIELAIKAADITLWEYDVRKQLFFSDNEPLNDYDVSVPLTMAAYMKLVHPKDKKTVGEIMYQLEKGEKVNFNEDIQMNIHAGESWQYCTLNGLPFEHDIEGRVVKYVGTRTNNTKLHKRKLLQDRILNDLPLSVLIKDVEDNFRYVFCNDESKRMFGTREEMTAYDVMDEEQVERIRKSDWEVYTTGRPFLGSELVVLKDGRQYDTIVRKSLIEDGAKRLVLTTRWDQGYQNDLKRRSKVLTMTMEAMNAFTWFFDIAKNRVSFGEGFSKMGKRAVEVNSPSKYIESIHPEDQELFVTSLNEVVARESGMWSVEYKIDLKGDGSYQWWRTQGVFEKGTVNEQPYKYMFGMTLCVDHYKQTELALIKKEEALKELVKRNELILNNTNSGLAYISKDFVVRWENVSICTASLSFEAYKQGEKCYVSAHNRTSPCPNCVLKRAMKSRQMEEITFSILGNSIQVFATPVFDDQDEVAGVVIRIDDVTEREHIIVELRAAKAKAEESDKLKSAFLANMSHEIRTPLNAIVGFSELLLNCEEEERREYIQIIATNNDLLLKLINDILDLSKIEAGSVELKYEKFDLADFFEELSVSMKQHLANPEVQLKVVNPYDSCWVVLDRNRVAQIMGNYVTNAIKYTPKGTIEMGYHCKDNRVYFYVNDTGIGIPDEKRHKVFHRFEKLDEFAQGTGLGLSICKAIAESMHGRVGYESVYGKGSTFWAELPCNSDIELHKSPLHRSSMADSFVAHTACGLTKGRKLIIVAEDIDSNFKLLTELLGDYFDLVHAPNGEEVVRLARTTRADLIFMDMKMPLMDGVTATKKIREFNTQLPIVGLTAHAFEADRQLALEAGCNDYLVKPINRTRLFDMLERFGMAVTDEE